jgi:hypothetical protein
LAFDSWKRAYFFHCRLTALRQLLVEFHFAEKLLCENVMFKFSITASVRDPMGFFVSSMQMRSQTFVKQGGAQNFTAKQTRAEK